MNPDKVHEILAIALLIFMLPMMILVLRYLRALDAFFKELAEKEPELAREIGSPRLLNMVALPFLRFRKYTAFLPHLKQRANDPESGYQHAGRAYRRLLVGLCGTAIMFSLVSVTAIWMVYHGL